MRSQPIDPDEYQLSLEEEKKRILEEIAREEMSTQPFGTWVIKRFISRSDGRNKSKLAIRETQEFTLRHPGSKPLIIRRKTRGREKWLIGVPIGIAVTKFKPYGKKHYKHKFFGFSPDRRKGLNDFSKLDKYIDEELREKEIDLGQLGKNAEDFFLDCVYKIFMFQKL